jgi:ubiquinone/menaquinone biosynthesis C-methylase UbiE
MQEPGPAYYSARAHEYERIYDKPERQSDLAVLKEIIPAFFDRKSVLEVACGTGYWTQFIARRARTILATDCSQETLAVARQKALPADQVRFESADAFSLPERLGTSEAAFCGFWWSHIPRTAIGDFLASLHARLQPGSTVVVLDNLYVPGSNTAISRRSATGDTFQQRALLDGSTHEILKNFPTEDELRGQLRGYASRVSYVALQYYWYLEYQVLPSRA